VGNFPQAFSHVSLINSACRLTGNDPLAPAYAGEAPKVVEDDILTPAVQKASRLGRVAFRGQFHPRR
jgi:hypothetical protein